MTNIKVLSYKVNEKPEIIEMQNDLDPLKEFVGGHVQAVPLRNGCMLVCNEEGMLIDLPYQNEYKLYGDFLIAGVDGAEFASLTDEEISYIKENIQELLSYVLR